MISDPWYKSQKPWPFWPGLEGVSRMQTIVCLLPSGLRDTFRSRVALQLDLTALRHRLTTMNKEAADHGSIPVGYVTTLHDPG